MPACNIQCSNETDVDCGPCKHRDRDYPWPGENVNRKLYLKGQSFDGSIKSVPMLHSAQSETVLVNLWFFGVWSHWE